MKIKDLPIGASLQDKNSSIIFLVAGQSHPPYGGTTMLCRNVIGVRCMDAAEPADTVDSVFERVELYGRNNYRLSNLHRWLNSDREDWYAPSHEIDTPPEKPYLRYGEQPYTAIPGFLSSLSPAFRAALLEVDVPVLERRSKDKGELITVKARAFIPSRTEVGKGDENGVAEGKMLPLFHDYRIFKAKPTGEQLALHGRSWNPGRPDAPLDRPQIYDPKYGWWYWMRTPSLKYAFLNRVASAYGAVSYTYANNDVVGIRPVVNLDGDTPVSGTGEVDVIYTVTE